MNWIHFIKVAYPEEMKMGESGRSIVWLINRWVGLRFAYVFYHLGFSANNISVIRLIFAALSFFFLSLVLQGFLWWPVFGLLLMILQIILDFADGAISRVQGRSGELGVAMDGIANVASRAAIIVLFGYYTNSTFWLWISVFSGFILSTFWDSTAAFVFKNQDSGKVRKLFRLSSSVIFMLIVLPAIIVLFNIIGLPLQEFSCIVTYCYTALAVLWLVLCCL